MKGASKVIMGATLVMVASLAIVLCLILVLLAELYCSLLLRRRKMKKSTTDLTTLPLPTTVADVISAENQTHNNNSTSPLTSFYSQGVLHPPRNLLFPLVPCKETKFELHSSFYAQNSINRKDTGFVSSPSPTASSVSVSSVREITIKMDTCRSTPDFLYISNPIYDNQATNAADTPFETPGSSPSCLEDGCSCSSDSEEDGGEICVNEVKIDPSSVCSPLTPPLTPMKKLPAQACSVPLRDVRSLGTSSNNDTNSNIGLSSSASCSPTTSPSW